MNLFSYRLGIMILCGGTFFSSTIAQDNDIELPAITQIVRQHFPINSKGGLALLVAKDGAVIHSKGYGKSNGETPINSQTKMPLASVTKQFAAMCAALLIEDGKLELTDAVSTYVPEFRVPPGNRELLIQDLIWHINGLPNFIKANEKVSIARYKAANNLERLSNKSHASWLATTELRRPPGVEFEYTNSGYVLLARIIEIVAKKPFHEFQQERIFDILGMENTSDSPRFNGSGNMVSTLEDYAKWDRALSENFLLNDETSQLIFKLGKLDNGDPVDYGFGWRLTYENDELVEVFHGGVGSPPRSARNIITRDIKNKVTVALFIRENLTLDKAKRRMFADEIRDYAITLP